jgi:hypothetical protein
MRRAMVTLPTLDVDIPSEKDGGVVAICGGRSAFAPLRSPFHRWCRGGPGDIGTNSGKLLLPSVALTRDGVPLRQVSVSQF